MCHLEQQALGQGSKMEDVVARVEGLAETFRAAQKEGDERWNLVLEKLKIVEDIQEIKTTLQAAGKLLSGAARGLKWLGGFVIILAAAIAAWKSGDVSGLLQAAGMFWGQ